MHYRNRRPTTRLAAKLRNGARRLIEQDAGAGWALLVIAAAIGASTAWAVLLFYSSIDIVHGFVYRLDTAALPTGLRWLYPAVAVAIALYIVTWLIRWLAPGPRLQPLPAVILAAARGGDVRQRGIWARVLGSVVTLGFGGSTGSEGPVVAAGAAFGSGSGKFLALRPNRLRVMLACGAAAGISAAFNAPIAGVMFALEEVLGTFSVAAFSPVVVASVMADVVTRSKLGVHPAFDVPAEFVLVEPRQIVLYVGLALAAAVFGVMYTRGIYASEDVLNRFPGWAKPLIGGAVIGALAIVFPQVLGPGRREIQQVLFGELAGLSLAGLAVAKIVATGTTLGAGGNGGFFSPALYVGATMGHAYGVLMDRLFPFLTTEVNAYALVGMGGVLAAATHAPISAIIIIFEMTGDYGLILPLMLTCVVSYLVAKQLYPESVYTEALRRAGEHVAHGVDQTVFERIRVNECYNTDPRTVQEATSVSELIQVAEEGLQMDLPVVDPEQHVVGIIPYQELLRVSREPHLHGMLLALDLALLDVEPVTPRDSALTAMRRMTGRGLEFLPVVEDGGRLLGIVSRANIWRAYDAELLRTT